MTREQALSQPPAACMCQPMGMGAWSIVFLVLSTLVFLVNRILPIPDLNDFTGLAQICLLMEQRGLKYCFNSNWGFAHPLLSYEVFRIVGNLLWAQRAISATAAVVLLVCQEKLMRTVFPIPNRWWRSAALLVLVCSAPMLDLLVSVHLDVLPLALVSVALCLLWSARPGSYFLGGFVAAVGGWFRPHFTIIAALLLILIVFYNPKKLGNVRLPLAGAGVLAASIVPTILALALLGSQPHSNGKWVIAMLTQADNSTVTYELLFSNVTYQHLLRAANWRIVFESIVLDLAAHPLVILLMLVVVLDGSRRFKSSRSILNNSYLVALYWSVAVFPLLPLRGITPRLEATLVLLLVPYVATIMADKKAELTRGLAFAVAALCILNAPGVLWRFHQTTKLFRTMDAELRLHLPEGIIERSPQTVLSGISDYYNRKDRLWLWNPVIIGGWPTRESNLRQEFGVVDLTNLSKKDIAPYISYIVVKKNPTQDFEICNKTQLQAIGEVQELESTLIVKVR